MAIPSYVGAMGTSGNAGTTWGANSYRTWTSTGTVGRLWCPDDRGIQAGDYILIYSIHKGAGAGADDVVLSGGTATTGWDQLNNLDSGTGTSPEAQTFVKLVDAGDIGNYWDIVASAGAGEGVLMGHVYRFGDTPTYNGTGSDPDFFDIATTAGAEDPILVSVSKTDTSAQQLGVFVGGSAVLDPDTQTFTGINSSMTLEFVETYGPTLLGTREYTIEWYHVESDAYSSVEFEWDRTGATGGNGAVLIAWPDTGAPFVSGGPGWAWHGGQAHWQVIE